MKQHLQDLLAALVVEEIAQTVAERSGGHRIRVDDLPSELANEACARLQNVVKPPALVRLVAHDPVEPWQVSPTAAVALRNEGDESSGVLVIFVPPETRLSVEDSIGVSTFESLRFDELAKKARAAALAETEARNPAAAEVAERVADEMRRYACDEFDVAAYLLAVAGDEGPEAAGLHLAELGLLPDAELWQAASDEQRRRLQLNDQQMSALAGVSDPAERLRQLPIDRHGSNSRALISALQEAVADGTSDRRLIATRLAGRAGDVDYGRWKLDPETLIVRRFEILDLQGDFESGAERVIRRTDPSVGVRFVCEPAPASLRNARNLRLEILRIGRDADDLHETGISFTRSSLPRKTASTWKKRISVGDAESGLEPGLYRFRLVLVATDNTEAKTAHSEVFRVGTDLVETPAHLEFVQGFVDAAVKAVGAGHEPHALVGRTMAMDAVGSSVDTTVRYEGVGRAWAFSIPRLLADFESQLIMDPSLRGFEIDLDAAPGDERWLRFDAPLPAGFAAARADLFEALSEVQVARPEVDLPTVALADLDACSSKIAAYVEAWVEALRAGDAKTRAALLGTDRVHVTENGELVAVLVGPTHPLRLGWLARLSALISGWLDQAASLAADELKREVEELSNALDELTPIAVPLVALEEGEAFRFADSLNRQWGLWATAAGRDRMASLARVRAWLGLSSWRFGSAGELELLARVRAYLEAHPYVRRLVLNVVQPGEADLVLRLLSHLQSQTATKSLSYVIRLFGDVADSSLGSALDAFMVDPEGSSTVSREVADELTRPSPDPLFPKLAYSKHDVAQLLDSPEAFPAHISLFLDYFDVEIAPLPEPPSGRSLFAGGVLIDPVQRYTPGDDRRSPSWVNTIAVGNDGDFARAFRVAQNATAQTMGGVGLDPTPALRLELDTVSQAVLNAVHRSSDWVVIIDPVFSDDFLDRPGYDEGGSAYVIDMQSGSGRPGGRNVVVSTRMRREQSALLLDAARHFQLKVSDRGAEELMAGLQALGSGVALHLLMDERRAKEALSLALAAIHLRATGVLRHALVIPIDLHQDLFAEGRARGVVSSLNRTDLAVVQLDPTERRIGLHLVEVKVRSSLGAAGELPLQLAAEIGQQLSNTEQVLLDRLFGTPLRQRRYSLPAALQLQRLTVLLRRYLSRAVRHGYVSDSEARGLTDFVESLNDGYQVGVSKHGLIFHASGAGERIEEHEGVQLTVLGGDYIGRLLESPSNAVTVVAGRNAEEYLKTVFSTVHDWYDITPPPEEGPGAAGGPPSEEGPVVELQSADVAAAIVPQGPALEDVDLLGATTMAGQFGVIGVHASTRRPVAIDTSGTNVISVFGVQGSGKSYTVGALIEAALVTEPAINRLSSPLGTVIFHYSSDQTYVPEFASMVSPNRDPLAVEKLTELDASPHGTEDLVILVPNAVLSRRREEYSGTTVEPILLGPDELQLSDWKLLMGIAEGNQMYARAMSLVLGELRGGVTLASLEAAIQGSDLTTTQKSIALHRIKFTRPYVREGASVAGLMRPGRLLIVDLRDELIDKGEALALFMVLLNKFTQASDAGRHFNKLIVFDEAHKYMEDAALTDAITEVVREMRHKGASVVVASQNPPSVPQEIIELSTVIFAHKFTSPAWLRHLQKVSHAFGEMRGSQLTDLAPGWAYVWAVGNPKYHRPQRVEIRPRLTHHGGETRRATE